MNIHFWKLLEDKLNEQVRVWKLLFFLFPGPEAPNTHHHSVWKKIGFRSYCQLNLGFTLLCFSNLTLLIYDLCLRFATTHRVRTLETAAHCTSVSHVTQTAIPSPMTACSLTGTHGLTCSHKVKLSPCVLFFNRSLISANLIQMKIDVSCSQDKDDTYS